MDIRTNAEDVADVLEAAGVTIQEGDLVEPALGSVIGEGGRVIVIHAVPVTLVCGGDPVELRVLGDTVADALVTVGLDPARVRVEPGLDTTLEPGMRIEASDVFTRVTRETSEVPFETETVQDPTMPAGTTEVRTAGVPGRMLRIYETVVSDGVEGARTLLTERVLEQPVDEVVAEGTKRAERNVTISRGSDSGRTAPQASSQDAPAEGTGTTLTMHSTAYAPGAGAGMTTATGAKAGYGVVAVDPSVIPLGTRVHVDGYGYAVAADTGGAIDGNRIDVCFDMRSEALSWGRRTVTVTILD